jgi:metal-responsive CopG/Arc/MetJ family transcriptional regulator
MTIKKITFTLPKELVRRLEKVPPGKRSLLVKRAVEKELDREAAVEIVKRLRGKTIWREKDHPNLRTAKDFSQHRSMKGRLTR